MTERRSYEGSCHCGKVRFEMTTAIESVIACNCSICSRAGYLLHFVPENDFTLLKGEDALVDYLFNKHHVHHPFCGTCGVRAFGRGKRPDGKETYAVNVRCLKDVDLTAIPVKNVDGKSL